MRPRFTFETEGGPADADQAAARIVEECQAGLGDIAPECFAAIERLLQGVVEGATTVELAGPLMLDAPFFHHGDLVVHGVLGVNSICVVTGDLRADDVFDFVDDSVLVVLGDLHAHAVVTGGEIWVRGRLHARDVVYGGYNDHSLDAGGIEAFVVVTDEHTIHSRVPMQVAQRPSTRGKWGAEKFDLRDEAHRADLVRLFGSDTFASSDEAAELNWELLRRRPDTRLR